MLGREATHSWDGGAVVLNLRSAIPHHTVKGIDGLHSLGDFEAPMDPATARRGEIPRSAQRGGKTLVYKGFTRAYTLASLRDACRDLGAAFDTTAERKMTVAPVSPYVAVTRFFWARAVSLEMGDDIASTPFDRWRHEREFSLALRLSDPRFYDNTLTSINTGAIGAMGGTSVPIKPPFQIQGASGNGASATVNNGGSVDVDPIIQIYGPIWNPVISNETLPAALRFKDIYIATGDYVEIDFRTRTVQKNGASSSDLRNKLDLSSTSWWDGGVVGLLPGNNTIRLRGYSIASPAKATIKFYAPDVT